MKKYYFIVVVLVMIFSAEDAFTQLKAKQIRKNNRRISNYRGQRSDFGKDKVYSQIGISINSFNYFGDLAPLRDKISTDISFTRPGIGISYAYRFGPRYTVRGMFNYGTLRGDDFESADPNQQEARHRYVRNLHFRNRIKELTATAIFDLFKNEASYISRVQWTPYAFIGFSVFHHNPQALVHHLSDLPEAGQWVDLQPLGTEGQYSDLDPEDDNFGIEPYNKIQVAIPFGLGVRYKLNQVLDLSFETGFRYLFTDYIDDVSQNYVDLNTLKSDLARELSDRSQEQTAAVSGQPRDFNNPNIAEIVNNTTIVDGRTLIAGYGHEYPDNMRGNENDRDIYVVTSIKISYILGASFRRAKFR